MLKNDHILGDLTAKQAKVVFPLASGESAKEVSKKFGISQAQMSVWRQDTKFMAAIDDCRRNSLKEAELALSGLAVDAVKTLRELLNNASNEQTKLRAATYIIDRLDISSNIESEEREVPGEVNMSLLLAALGTR